MRIMKKHVLTIAVILFLLAGLSLLLYPTLSDQWNSQHQSKAIAGYTEAVATLSDDDYARYWADALAYNQDLPRNQARFFPTAEELEAYKGLLNISGNDIMGYLEIPRIGCLLPIYHGTDEAVLQIAVGHIVGTSLPVGGKGTHCVLSGHRGLPSAKLFTNLDLLSEGDWFMLHVLNETLVYQVDQILTVLPEEIEALDIDADADYCTLVTCTPYGVNTHRLLVRGHRIAYEEAQEMALPTAEVQSLPSRCGPWLFIGVIALLTVFVGIVRRRKRRMLRR